MKRISKIYFRKGSFEFDSKKDFDSLSTKGFGFEENGSYYLFSYEVAYLLKKEKIHVLKKDVNFSLSEVLSLSQVDNDLFLVYEDLGLKSTDLKVVLLFLFRIK